MAEKKTAKGTFTAEERAAMKERAKELKAAKTREEGERALLAKVAEMPASDRAMAERLHAIVTKTAPSLWPKTWYGMPAYARDDKIVCFFRAQTSSSRGTRPSASTTPRTSTTAPCGRPPLR